MRPAVYLARRIGLGMGCAFRGGLALEVVYFVVVVLAITASLVFGVTWSVLKGDIQCLRHYEHVDLVGQFAPGLCCC